MTKKMQMFFLPFAGGNSTSFNKLIPFIDDRVEKFTVEYAGRMTRKNEEYINNYNDFLIDVSEQIHKYREASLPAVLFGYSLGSVILYDLLSSGMVEGQILHAFICAKGSLLKKAESQDYANYPDEKFIKEIIALGGTDERIIQNKRFLSIYMEPVKADYIIWGQYEYKEGRIPCDATAIYSNKDPAARGVHDWTKIVGGTVDYFELGTNHFFINEYWLAVGTIVNNHINKYM